jgi:hypothetical protein
MGGHVQAIDKSMKVNNEQFYSLLIVVPEEVDSYECVNVLNFFGFPFNVEEDTPKGIVRDEMGFDNETPYPCLMVESNQDDVPNLDIGGSNLIFQTLIK